jgi:hypothetical protein
VPRTTHQLRRSARCLRLAVLAAVALCSVAATAGAPAAHGETLALANVVKLKLGPNDGTLQIGCKGTGTQTCAGIVEINTGEVLEGSQTVGVIASTGPISHTAVRVAEVLFTVAAGQTVTVQITLNSTGVELLKRFGYLPGDLLGTESLAQGPYVFLVHSLRFEEPHKKHKHHKRRKHRHSH